MPPPSLLNRTNRSIFQSSITVEDLVAHAVKNGHSHVVISDFQTSRNWLEFYREATKHNLIPVFGVQINYRTSSLLFLAKNRRGYGELLKLVGCCDPEQVDRSDLCFIHLEGDDFFPEDEKYVANVEEDNGVYVRENKFVKASDYEFFCVLKAIEQKIPLTDSLIFNEQFIHDYLEMEPRHLIEDSCQLKNIFKILEECEWYDIVNEERTLGFFDDASEEMEKILVGAMEKIQVDREVYVERWRRELEVIGKNGLCDYFLVVRDAIEWARSQGISIGPGRGSVCGSLVAYLMGITEVDPIKYGLYFERFLNDTRTTMPDVDIDVDSKRREELVGYLRDKYGEDYVAFVSVIKQFRVKVAIRDIGRAFDISEREIDFYLKEFRNDDVVTKEELEKSKLVRNFPDIAKHIVRLQNFPHGYLVHVSGVIISSVRIGDWVPVVRGPLVFVAQWDACDMGKMGFVKFDFLSSQYLHMLGNMEREVRRIRGSFDWSEVELDDAKVYETLIKGFNAFVFQFEGEKINQLIHKFRPESIMDLALISSIYRPGASDQISVLLARKTAKNHGVEDSLEETYGLLVYQEQLMALVVETTGCTLGEADNFRRAISNPESIEELRKWFREKALERFDEKRVQEVWDSIIRFAKYGFNKSHAVAYALVSYRCAWLKTHYPEIFYPEVLVHSNNPKCFCELESMGFMVCFPSYGFSEYDRFSVVDRKVYMPMSQIHGLDISRDQYDAIPGREGDALGAIRECMRCGVSMDDMRILIRAGFFNWLFGPRESEVFFDRNLEVIWDNSMYVDEKNRAIFDLDVTNVECSAEDFKTYAEYKRELLGLSNTVRRIRDNVFEKHPQLKRIHLVEGEIGPEDQFIGFVSEVYESSNYRHQPFLFIRLSDGFYVTPRLFFSGDDVFTLEEWMAKLKENPPIIAIITRNSDDYYRILKIKVIS